MTLGDNEKVTYLANLIAVSRADGTISPNETLAIEEAQKRIGAKKTDLRKADSLAQSEMFEPVTVGSFSAKISNLEDMLVVSMVDGVLDPAEKPIILSFAKQIGITNEQLQLIVSEVKAAITSSVAARACPVCSEKVPCEAKFCPKCGASLDTTDREAAVAVEYSIPANGITLEFAESTASGFVDAVRKAKMAPENAECIKGKKTWYMASWPIDQISAAAKLSNDLKGMRNRKAWIDGKECSWDEAFGFTWCSEQRDTAYRPLEYCFGIDEKRLNLWGCKNARMDWSSWSQWFSYGIYKKNSILRSGHIFVFDKQRIRHELETNLFRVRFCPYLNFQLVEAVLNHWPDEVEVTPKGDWTYRRDYEESPGSIKIKIKTVEEGYTYTDEYYTSGVSPRTPAIGLAILKKAIDATKGYESDLKGVLSYRGE